METLTFMEYDTDYISLRYALMSCFLFKADKNILDISYSADKKTIAIQVVLLEGFSLSEEKTEKIKESLSSFDVVIAELHLTKEQFNESKGEWQPQYYNWLDCLLFSKAEAL